MRRGFFPAYCTEPVDPENGMGRRGRPNSQVVMVEGFQTRSSNTRLNNIINRAVNFLVDSIIINQHFSGGSSGEMMFPEPHLLSKKFRSPFENFVRTLDNDELIGPNDPPIDIKIRFAAKTAIKVVREIVVAAANIHSSSYQVSAIIKPIEDISRRPIFQYMLWLGASLADFCQTWIQVSPQNEKHLKKCLTAGQARR